MIYFYASCVHSVTWTVFFSEVNKMLIRDFQLVNLLLNVTKSIFFIQIPTEPAKRVCFEILMTVNMTVAVF
jgi:hypothetical protein